LTAALGRGRLFCTSLLALVPRFRAVATHELERDEACGRELAGPSRLAHRSASRGPRDSACVRHLRIRVVCIVRGSGERGRLLFDYK